MIKSKVGALSNVFAVPVVPRVVAELPSPSSIICLDSHVVTRTYFAIVPLCDAQAIDISHCVQCAKIDRHYGEFQLLDQSDRVLGTSVGGVLSLLKKDLQTEVARVWYDAMARASPEFRRMHDVIDDPGLDLGSMQPLRIRFLNVPADVQKFIHIPIQFLVTSIWDPRTFNYETK